ncbi:MAG TPA: hypothetical protein VH855_24300 [Acetobacteraceae bacterium]|jgi:hypothetical protein
MVDASRLALVNSNRDSSRRGLELSASYFATICEAFGGPERLHSLVRIIREQPAGPSVDARIALELGWLRPYSEWRDGDRLATGVITGDYGETYLLYAPWFTYAPRDWWDDGTAICNRVPNIPRYTSEPNAALLAVPGMQTEVFSVEIIKRAKLWTARVLGYLDNDPLGSCNPGVESMAKAIVLAGIDCRLRRLRRRGLVYELRQE